jgi:hypothetical protein
VDARGIFGPNFLGFEFFFNAKGLGINSILEQTAKKLALDLELGRL